VTQLQVMAYIFRFAVCISSDSGSPDDVLFLLKFFFVRLHVSLLQGFEVARPIFEISMTLRTQLPDAFHHLVPNDNFHCQMPFS